MCCACAICTHVCPVLVYVEASGGCYSPLYVWIQGLSLNLKLTVRASLAY